MSGMTLCARLETVLKDYAKTEFSYVIRDVWSQPSLQRGLDWLLDDLAACWTQPSREALVKILLDYRPTFVQDFGKDVAVRTIVLDTLMAWATGLENKTCEKCGQQLPK